MLCVLCIFCLKYIIGERDREGKNPEVSKWERIECNFSRIFFFFFLILSATQNKLRTIDNSAECMYVRTDGIVITLLIQSGHHI